MGMVQFCPRCGSKAIDDESLFCARCGSELPNPQQENEPESCPNCGREILDATSLFCDKCGSRLSGHAAPETRSVRSQSRTTGKTCPECGTMVGDGRYYCKMCGAYIHGERDDRYQKRPITESSSRKKTDKSPTRPPKQTPDTKRGQYPSDQKSIKRLSKWLPTVFFIAAFILVIWVLIQTGLLNQLFKLKI